MMVCVQVGERNPWRNLATEEALLDLAEAGETVLFLWQSGDAVIIGKNQNPWRECDLPLMRREGVKLARRLSGGGAVFHDPGNLNFSLMFPRGAYDAQRVFAAVVSALSRLGIRAEKTGRHSLLVGGRKVSGHAFCFRRYAALHHGTLLVNANLEKLERCLAGTGPAMETRAIASVRDRVMNLGEVRPGLDIPTLSDALKEECAREFCGSGSRELETPPCPLEVLARLESKYASWEWMYGLTPDFETRMEESLGGSRLMLRLRVSGAYITEAAAESDLLSAPDRTLLCEALLGVPFNSQAMAQALARFPEVAARLLDRDF